MGTSYTEVSRDFQSKGYGDTFDSFIRDFHDSVGANLVPVSHYAQIIELIYRKGYKIFINLIMHFIISHRAELSESLKFLAHGETERYRNYMRELNWEIYL